MLRSLAVALAAALLALAFLLIGGEVTEGDTRRFDLLWLRRAQALRASHPGLVDVLRDLSGLGSTSVLALFTALTVGFLVLVSQRRTAILVTCSVVGGSVLVAIFKVVFGRMRPDAVFAEFIAPGPSFPSGHAGMSAIVFLTLGALVAATRTSTAQRTFILSTAALLTVLVGLSRALLGVHWATDVIGGWAFGTGWALLGLLLNRRSPRAPMPERQRPGPGAGTVDSRDGAPTQPDPEPPAAPRL